MAAWPRGSLRTVRVGVVFLLVSKSGFPSPDTLRPAIDYWFLFNVDGFLPWKDQSLKSLDLGYLQLLTLPHALRPRPEMQMVLFGVTGTPSNMNRYLEVALAEFFASDRERDANPDSA